MQQDAGLQPSPTVHIVPQTLADSASASGVDEHAGHSRTWHTLASEHQLDARVQSLPQSDMDSHNKSTSGTHHLAYRYHWRSILCRVHAARSTEEGSCPSSYMSLLSEGQC